MTAWWNSSYKFRRRIKLTVAYDRLMAGTVLAFPFDTLSISQSGKVRSDYADIEVIKHIEGTTTSYKLLSHSVDDHYVYFELADNINLNAISDQEYYVYYGNPQLYNILTNVNDTIISVAPINTYARIPNIPIKIAAAPPISLSVINSTIQIPYPIIINDNDRPAYNGDLWSTHLLPTNPHISYTRPGEYWIDGVSDTYNAVATIRFASDRIRMVSQTGNHGIAEVRIDDEDWERINLFSSTTISETVVYTKVGLAPMLHTLQLRVTGQKDLGSTDSKINFVRFETLSVGIIENLGEEVDPSLVWSSILGGGS